LNFDYSPYSKDEVSRRTVRDFESIRDEMPNLNFKDALFAFLSQFHDSDGRNPTESKFQESAFSGAAEFQRDLILQEPDLLADLFSEITMVALALHCFVLAHELHGLGIEGWESIAGLEPGHHTILRQQTVASRANGLLYP
jgi:hypothetical protein